MSDRVGTLKVGGNYDQKLKSKIQDFQSDLIQTVVSKEMQVVLASIEQSELDVKMGWVVELGVR